MGRRALVCGAGIAGPALAYWLLRAGFEPVLLERAAAPRRGGSLIDFWGAGYDVAERMQVLPELQRRGYRIRELRLADAHGRALAGFDAGVFRDATDDRFFSIARDDLSSVLLQAIADRIELRFGDSVSHLSQDPSGVDVAFERAAAQRFDLVIGADGVHSLVRRLVLGDGASREKHLGYGVATFSAACYSPRDEGVYVTHGVPGRQIARFALRDGRSAFLFMFAAVPSLEHGDTAAQQSLLRELYRDVGWECAAILDTMSDSEDFYCDAVTQVPAGAWSLGRVALVGDAAACPSLLAGEGASLAMAGAYALSAELAGSPDSPAAAFARYEARMKPYVQRKQRAAARFGSWFVPRTRAGLALRVAVIRLMKLPAVGRWMARRFVADRLTLPDWPAPAGQGVTSSLQ